MFNTVLNNVKHDTVSILARVRVRDEEDVEQMERQRQQQQNDRNVEYQHAESSSFSDSDAPIEPEAAPVETFVRDGEKVGRNTACPCGSGKKFKHCHGRLS